MPLYELTCTQCGASFEELVPTAEAVETVTCPACGTPKPRKRYSTFAARMGRAEFVPTCPTGGCCPGGACGL